MAMKKRLLTTLLLLLALGALSIVNYQLSVSKASAQSEVMLQGFYWDSYSQTRWTKLEKQADELARYFDLIWVPNSGYCGDSNNMGYLPLYYFQQNSSFGTEAELRSMIKTFKEKGLGTVADIVINHHNTNGWFGFPSETYKGETYQFQSTDICKNDDGGSTLNQANSQGVSLSGNNDTGEDWSGTRDLDHTSANVQRIVKAYLHFLLEDIGYTGFRYDMVKGYSASFTGQYNADAKPRFSVGECWDGSTAIKNWINGTKVDGVPTSSAFDFQFRYRVRDAINQNNWTLLSASTQGDAGKPLVYDATYRPYAVTFVENHDTEYRSASAPQDPIKGDTLAANAYLLAMPGTPCIFLKHWLMAKGDLKRMISARKLVGITNTSTYKVKASQSMYYAVETTGNNGKLICVVGKTPKAYSVPSGYTQACSGTDFIYYIPNELASQWATIEERIRQEAQQPDDFKPHSATIYVRDELNWNRMNFYIWDSDDNTQLNGGWPGKQITATKKVGDYTWYYQTFNIKSADYYVNVVFSTGTGSPQTVDVTEISEDKYFVIKTTQAGSKYIVEEDKATGIEDLRSSSEFNVLSSELFDLSGRKVTSPHRKGVYIKQGRKIVK